MSVTKGMSTQRMVALMAEVYGIEGVSFDMVLCIGACCSSLWSVCVVVRGFGCKIVTIGSHRCACNFLEQGADYLV